ncbi:hypothetical protein GCM10025859_17170 [Alicyclobacillus fastidiosus]|nr:hypothetical protein GCM10025859_17170 [Alicyclobacillus fastidiosus]
MATKTIACRILDNLRIPYQLHEYDWDEQALDAGTVAEKVGIAPSQIFKTLVLRGDKTGVFMACVPGNQELDLKSTATVSGNKKVEMVPVKELQTLTGYIRGGVSPLGVRKSIRFTSTTPSKTWILSASVLADEAYKFS